MKSIRIITAICWLIVATMLIGLALWFLTGTLFGIKTDRWNIDPPFAFGFGSVENLSGPFIVDGTYSAEISAVDSLNIDWVAGDVTVMPHDGDEIKITELARRELRDNEKLTMNTSGRTLTIKYHERSGAMRIPQKRLEVLIPQELCENLTNVSINSVSGVIIVSNLCAASFKVDTISGDIQVSNIAAQSFDADSTSGSINVTSVHTEGMNVESISGHISVSDTTAATIVSESVSGALDMSGTFDSVTADSMSGDILVRSTVVPLTLKAVSISGSITVIVPNEGEITVRHSSVSGRLSSDIPIIVQAQDARFYFSTVSGNSRILALS